MYICIVILVHVHMYMYSIYMYMYIYVHMYSAICSAMLPWWLSVKNLPEMQKMQEMGVRSLGWEDPLEEGMAIHSSILSGESHGQRRLVGYRA